MEHLRSQVVTGNKFGLPRTLNENDMPQILTNTTTPLGYVIAAMQSQVNAMIASMAAGNSILASDVAQLVAIYNSFVSHYHGANDLRGINTYGNLPRYGAGTYVYTTTSAPTPALPAGSVPGNVAANGEITAADINAIITLINSMRTHVHDITDTTA